MWVTVRVMQPVEPRKDDLKDGRDSVDPAIVEIPAESTAVSQLAVSTHATYRSIGRSITAF
jgi:hypothetical protein